MRKLLLASAAGLALISAPVDKGKAFDCPQCATVYNQVAEAARQVQQMEQQYQELIQQLQSLQQIYSQAQQIYGQVTRAVNPNSIMSELDLPFGQDPLDQFGNTITGFVRGGTGSGEINSLASQFLNQDTIYKPAGSDFTSTQMTNRMQQLENVMALAQEGQTSIQQHISGINRLREQLSSVSSQADLTAVQGRIEAEGADLQAQGVQAQQLQSQVSLMQQIAEEQQRQTQRQGDDQLFNDTQPISGGDTSSPVPSNFVASN